MAEKIMHHLQKKTQKTVQNNSKQICGWISMWEDNGMNLYTGGNIIMDYEQKGWFKLKMMDSFIDWIYLFTCEKLWCFYQLFGLWRHTFTANDPLVSKLCNAKFPQFCSGEWNKLIYILDGKVPFKQI